MHTAHTTKGYLWFGNFLFRNKGLSDKNARCACTQQMPGECNGLMIANTYFWFHVGKQTPKWFIFETSPQIPQSIDNGCNGQMHDPLFRSNLEQTVNVRFISFVNTKILWKCLPNAIAIRWSIHAKIRQIVHRFRRVPCVRRPSNAVLWRQSRRFRCHDRTWMLSHNLRCDYLFSLSHKHKSSRGRCAIVTGRRSKHFRYED